MATPMAKDTPLQFKGTTLKVIQTLLKSPHPATLKAALSKLTGDAPDFFDGEPAVLDFTGIEAFPEQIDWDALTALLRAAGLTPALIRGVPSAHEAAAARAGLHPLRDESFGRPTRAAATTPSSATQAPPPDAVPSPAKTSGSPAAGSAQTAERAAAPIAPAKSGKAADAPLPVSAAPAAPTTATAPPAEPPAPRTLVIDKPLRSGQRVYAKGGDLVVLAMVSAGAEVIADGNIHIYAPLRGRALAGASGDQNARIMTTCMEAELVSVAGLYRTFEQGVPREVAGQPAIVRWQAEGGQGSLLVAPLAIR